ncbi:hypothetical protein AAGQ96_03260 [Pantoea sp. MBD-2R]|uniref:hypothetical protein n=1 Tax=Pantoea sp. MBD-2R TaxID=3141540 RepID=UPI0031835D18
MYFLEEVTQDGVVLASAEFVQQRATGAAGEAGHGRAAILLVCIDQPVLQAVARPVQHLIFGDAPVARIAGRLPLIFHGQAGGIAVRGHQIAAAIPTEALAALIAIVNKDGAPLAFANRIRLVKMKLVLYHQKKPTDD